MPPISYYVKHRDSYELLCRVLAKYKSLDIRTFRNIEVYRKEINLTSNVDYCRKVWSQIDSKAPNSKELWDLSFAVRHGEKYFSTDRTISLLENFLESDYRVKKYIVEDWEPDGSDRDFFSDEPSSFGDSWQKYPYWNVLSLMIPPTKDFSTQQNLVLRHKLTFWGFNRVSLQSPNDMPARDFGFAEIHYDGEYKSSSEIKGLTSFEFYCEKYNYYRNIDVYEGFDTEPPLEFDGNPIFLGVMNSKNNYELNSQIVILIQGSLNPDKARDWERDTFISVLIKKFFFWKTIPNLKVPYNIRNSAHFERLVKSMPLKPLEINPIKSLHSAFERLINNWVDKDD